MTTFSEPVSAADANRNFSKLLKGVRQGRSYVVTSHGEPVAKLTPIDDGAPVSQERIAARRRHLEELSARAAANAPKTSRDELYAQMLAEPFRP